MSRIAGLNREQFIALREALSYTVGTQAAYFSSGWRARKRYLLSARGDFPTGLLTLVLDFINENRLTVKLDDKRIKPVSSSKLFEKNLEVDKRKYQEDAVKLLSSMDRGGAEMVTGSGKSITMALLIEKLQLKTLVIVPNLELKQQLTQTFNQMFSNVQNIAVENIASPKLKTMIDYDVLILDECHHAAAKTYRKLNSTAWKGIYHRYFFSGTFFRSQDSERLLLQSIVGECGHKYGYHEAVSDSAIVPIEAYYYDLPKQVMKGDPKSYPSVYSELVVNNSKRNQLIKDLLVKLHLTGKSSLCLVKEISHGKTLSCDGAFNFANGQDEHSTQLIRKFNDKAIKVLIGTTGVLGEGVDTRPAEYIIIAGLGKSKNQFIQQVGRGVRKHTGKETCKVIIFRDCGNKYTLDHFRHQVRYLKQEYGVIPVKLEA